MNENQQTQKSPGSPGSLTETLKETPPHGMKGPLESDGFITPDSVLALAGLILSMAAILSAFVMIWIKYKSRSKRQVTNTDFADLPGLWAELRRAVSLIKTPRDNSSATQFDWNQFTSEVSLNLRRGLEIRTQVPVAECTTEEIMRMMSSGKLKVPVLSENEFKSTLQRLDAVRFGGKSMTLEEATALLESLKLWLQRLESDQNSEITASVTHVQNVDEKGGVRVFDT